MHEEFYYGQPQFTWDNLCDEAEDLLHEEQLGSHIVAIYPAGNRIYGLESYPPSIFCLYVDSVEALIDPISKYHSQCGFKTFISSNNSSTIIMADIFKWVKWICSMHFDWRVNAFLHAIPFGQHMILEDSSISNIMEACHKAMKEINFLLVPFGCEAGDVILKTQEYNNISPIPYLYNRAMTILYHTGKFLPNINPNWDKVVEANMFGINLDTRQKTYDLLRTEEILDGSMEYNHTDSMLSIGNAYPYVLKTIHPSTKKEISRAVMDFYRFQL